MMAGWGGFSEDELRKLQGKDQAVPAALGRGRKPASTNRSRQQLQRERALQTAARQKAGDGSPAPLPPDQQLLRPPPPQAAPQPPQAAPQPPQAAPQPEATAATAATTQVLEKMKEEKPAVNHEPAPVEDTPPIAKELEKQEVEIREKTRLEQLQQDQRMIEENNKRKKALLSKTIAEKSKQTQAEAVKLKRIQKELQALDDMVSNDIGILRSRIEEATWDYSAASKRYEKAETEYVAAKLDLHKKTEVKEQLTEHLYAIIQENEQRKARKLEQLMNQLQLQASSGEEEEKDEKKKKEEVVVEEKEEKKGGQSEAEAPGEGRKEEKEIQENGEVAVQSSPDEEPRPGGETEKQGEEEGASSHQDCPPVTEPKRSEQDCKQTESSLQSVTQTLASAS